MLKVPPRRFEFGYAPYPDNNGDDYCPIDFIMNTHSEAKINADIFTVPSYCKDNCPKW